MGKYLFSLEPPIHELQKLVFGFLNLRFVLDTLEVLLTKWENEAKKVKKLNRFSSFQYNGSVLK